MYEYFFNQIWILTLIFWGIGLLFWVITYIGAPIASKKNGKFVSGTPGVPFICFFVAGFMSPYKWLILVSLLDFSIVLLPIHIFKKYIKKDTK